MGPQAKPLMKSPPPADEDAGPPAPAADAEAAVPGLGSVTDPDTESPLSDPVARAKVDLARNFTFHLLKGIKQIGMYRHAEGKFPGFLEKAHAAINQFTEQHGPLQLKVESENFLIYDQPLFAEQSPLPYKFYRDGIRTLLFRPDLPLEELVTFTLIALSEPERGAEEVVAQLWRAGLEHIEYIVVEGFKMDEVGDQEVQVEVDKIVNFLHTRLRTDSTDYLRFARVSTEDLDSNLEGIDQIRGAVVSGVTADDALKAKLQKEIEEEEEQRLFPKLVSAVFQIVEGGLDDPKLLEDMFVQLLDAMLIREDFSTINQVILKLKAMEQKEGGNPGIAGLRSLFITKMGEEQRLSAIGEVLRNSRSKHPQDIVRYLQVLDTSMVPNLLAVLETIEIAENRQLLCDVLANYAKEVPDPFLHRIDSDRPQVIRDMVYILEKANHPDKIKMFAKVLSSKNMVVKLEVMGIISRGRTGECRKLIADCLNDPVVQVRMLAVKLLADFDAHKALVELSAIVKDPAFAKKEPAEKAAFYAAIGATGLPAAISMLTQLVQTRSTLFNKQKVLEDKLLAVQGLQAACTIMTYKVLQELTDDKTQPSEVHMAAKKAMYMNKKTLFGDKEPPAA